MKTLHQVEPRTPIAHAPYIISQAGSYYLTTNLSSASHGVVITASEVTLDLMGFTLSGDRGTSDNGVYLEGATNSTIQNVVVRNGIVRILGFGVHAGYTQNRRFERLITVTNSSSGIYLNGSDSGQCDGNTITDCTVNENTSNGIYLNGDDGQCNGNTIADCTINRNSYGVQLYSGSSGSQCDGNTIADCTLIDNENRGIQIIYAKNNRVEGNHISRQSNSDITFGIYCGGTEGNLFFHNTSVGYKHNFSLDSDDTYGPITTNTGALSGTDPWANFSR